ncbi:sigma 54-interacting transcriptional regulator [Pedobacter sp. ISL-68]|uniref:sigma 54-interacting response regulator n=1 Tax=unclassified Pedobacter TaxID=2628915 RepID=UPI001BEAABF2|nr:MULTISPECIES: sigma 54-interacting response regulator [unclassified Pedobacter]MBT2560647.1 sigma 54-interacting transcriptional regulator [Pedobacter sp. ISL-64]MBT2590026.1 sigma 54-interacting transcriptional regulator [Pedobacter sp. ISL-68]
MPKEILIVEDEFIIADTLSRIIKKAGYGLSGIANTVAEALEIIHRKQPDFVLIDIQLIGELSGIDLANSLTELNLPFIFISANSNQKILEAAKKTKPYGFVIKPFRDKDVIVALEIALYRYENNKEIGFRQDTALQRKAAQIINSDADWKQKLLGISKALQPYVPFEYVTVGFKSEREQPFNEYGFLRIGYDEYQNIGPAELATITGISLKDLSTLSNEDPLDSFANYYDQEDLIGLLYKQSIKKLITKNFKMNSHFVLPLQINGKGIFFINFYSRLTNAYGEDHLLFGNRYEKFLTGFIDTLLSDPQQTLISTGKVEYRPANREQKIEKSNLFEGIIGNSHLLLKVFDNIIQVAPANSSVLILGESGTGKEKIAHRIHALSPRNNKPYIKVNCAALPITLIESELFGHEKGSFTGAYDKKIGKFEQAHTGTIFLDEIGEIPLEIQVKLLRVLQEKEIERVGGRETIKTDVRIVAATNRNLEQEVAEGRFRLDLYYRLNVIPIVMPALRDRIDDIPVLAKHFLTYYNRKTGKNVRELSNEVVDQLKTYHWPGNIRELENLIERNILLSKNDQIDHIDLPRQLLNPASTGFSEPIVSSMSESEKTHILAALKKCNGKIWGTGGAAELLKLPPTTLNSKMKRLGIKKDFNNYH